MELAEKNKKPFFLKPGFLLVLLYLLSVAMRFALALFFRHGPSVTIDESLYINIAKSLAAGEGIAYRAQPVPYLYILYPLVLAPLYLSPLPFDLYRVVQFLNAVLISSSVFPLYLFAMDFTKNRRKAAAASVLTLLMPDMQMAGFLMTESLIWPLTLWMVFFAHRMITRNHGSVLYGCLTGLFTALLFWTKPGAVAMGLAVLAASLFSSRQQGKIIRRRAGLAGLAVCVCCIAVFYILYTTVFGYAFSALGLYKKQLTEISLKWVAAVAEFSVLQLFLFAVSCGGLFFVLPVCFCRGYSESGKAFFYAFMTGLIVTAVGTAAFVDMFLWSGSFTNPQLHLRYMAMYVPAMIVFSLGTDFHADNRTLAGILTALTAVLLVIPGASVGFVADESTYIDSLSLSAWLTPEFLPPAVGIILTAATVLFLLQACIRFLSGKKVLTMKTEGICFLAFFLLYNNVCGYAACNIHRDLYDYGEDAMQINSILEDSSEKTLLVTGRYDDPPSYLLEARLRKPQQMVTADALMKALSDSDGVYTPFVPEDEEPNVGCHSTPAAEQFVFTSTALGCMEISSDATVLESQNGGFLLVQAPDGCRLLDTMLCGLDSRTLQEGASARFVVFNGARYRNGKLTLDLSVRAADTSAELEVTNAGKTETFSLSDRGRTCIISLREGDTVITAKGGDIIVSGYWTN